MEGVIFFDSFFVFFMFALVVFDCILLWRLTACSYSFFACFCFFALSFSIFFWFTRASCGATETSTGITIMMNASKKNLFPVTMTIPSSIILLKSER
jgi:hypothetical protein